MRDTNTTCSRPIQSCSQCRRRKIKCNKTYPCAPCLLRGEGDSCREVERVLTSSNNTATETLSDVIHRVTVLEKTVLRLSKFLPPDALGMDEVEPELTSSSRTVTSPTVQNRSHTPRSSVSQPTPILQSTKDSGKEKKNEEEKSKSAIRSAYGSTSTDEDVAMMLEDFAMGHRVNRRRATQDLESEHSGSYSHIAHTAIRYASEGNRSTNDQLRYRHTESSLVDESSNENERMVTFGLPARHPLSLLVDSDVNVVGKLVGLLPSEEKCRVLVQFYFDRLEWYTKVLHRPSFLEETDNLSRQIHAVNASTDTSTGTFPASTPAVFAYSQISLPFLSVYFMVLCLSLHLIESDICRTLNLEFGDANEMSKRMYNAAQACFWVWEGLGNHCLEGVQAIILMGVYQQNLDEADSHWALLGSAIKIAQNLGISRLGSERDNKTYTGIWKSVVKREVARRVWWSLIFNDWSHAAAHNGTYSVHPEQNHTGLPANIDDEDLVEGKEIREKPVEEYTEMTLSLTRYRFVELYREIVDYMQAPTGYGFVLEMDAKLRKMLEEVPRYFQTEDARGERSDEDAGDKEVEMAESKRDVKKLELTLCLLMGENRQLRLHRPYLFRGYKDNRYAKSRKQCVDSARAILRYLKSNDEHSAILLKWWMILFYGFAASVVLFIDLCHHKADDAPITELEQRRTDLREALDLFKTVEHISTVSRNAIALLEGLMMNAGAEPDIPSKPSRKRGLPDDDDDEPFERVVKRMILEAHRGTGSPVSHSSSSPSASTKQPSLVEERSCVSYDSGLSSLRSTSEKGTSVYPTRLSIPASTLNPSQLPSFGPPRQVANYSSRSQSQSFLLADPNRGFSSPPTADSSNIVHPVPGFGLGWGLPGRDVLAPAILFREEGIFDAGTREFDEQTMCELGQLLGGDGFDFGNGDGWTDSNMARF